MKRLYKSEKDKKICGVCGGIADYFGIDPSLIRLAWLLITIFTALFGGTIAYFIAAAVLPNEPLGQ